MVHATNFDHQLSDDSVLKSPSWRDVIQDPQVEFAHNCNQSKGALNFDIPTFSNYVFDTYKFNVFRTRGFDLNRVQGFAL